MRYGISSDIVWTTIRGIRGREKRPVGVIINALSVVIGGILETAAGHKLSPKFKADLTMIFGLCSMGMGISTIANMENMPAVIFPLTTPAMINDFKACGGFLIFATGFRMVKIKNFPIADMIPAMILVMPLSYIWTNYIMPFV